MSTNMRAASSCAGCTRASQRIAMTPSPSPPAATMHCGAASAHRGAASAATSSAARRPDAPATTSTAHEAPLLPALESSRVELIPRRTHQVGSHCYCFSSHAQHSPAKAAYMLKLGFLVGQPATARASQSRLQYNDAPRSPTRCHRGRHLPWNRRRSLQSSGSSLDGT